MVKSRKDIFSSNSHSHRSSLNNNNNKCSCSKEKQPTIEIKEKKLDDDDSFNSGFGQYLRSAEGVQMMTLFVLANSVVIILTMAWPSFVEFYRSIKERYFEEEE